MGSEQAKYLVVVRGKDAGARLLLTDRIALVGRARDANLVLSDRSVSRHHFHVHVTEEGAYVHACSDTAPFVHEGREATSAEARLGDTILVGNTLLLVTEGASTEPTSYASDGATTVGALLTGAAADVRGLAAVFALNEMLSTATDVPALESALGAWAKAHAMCEAIDLSASGGAQPEVQVKNPVLESEAPGGGTRIVAPAPGAPSGWIAFTIPWGPDRVTDSMRRLLVLAAALTGSRLTQLALLMAAKEEGESFRRQAVGSARAFLGTSAAAGELVRLIPKLAGSDVTALLMGETGVGKSFVARLIHESGPRAGEPFRAINCAAIPENLIESELFGHARGAFTGAVAAHGGAFEAAGRGTLFLDEIGELPLGSQAKLLRVLEEKRYERLGSTRSYPLQARVIAATNRDLDAMVAAGTFRSDLFFRVSVIKIVVPPLRERGNDVVLLAERMLVDLAASSARRVDGFSPSALEAIRRYPWPGNVRELRNVIEHALVLGDGRLLEASDFPPAIRLMPKAMGPTLEPDQPMLVELPMNEEALQGKNREAALLRTGGNKTHAAALLGIRRTTLYKK